MFEDFKNSIDFFIRNKTKFTRVNFVEKNIENIKRNEFENLYTKDILEKYFEKRNNIQARILDIGSKNWFYAKGEWGYFNSFCSDFIIDGVELDAHRLYSNFYSRYEYAKYYITNLKNANYIIGNLLDINQKYDYIIWILPFVLKNAHIFWGLPEKYFYPKKLLAHAYSLLEENGQMLIINQGENETKAQENMLTELEIPYIFLGEIQSEFFKYENKRFGFKILKN